MNELELYHYGIPRRSGRYPWGSKNNVSNSKQKTETTEEKKKRIMDSRDPKEVYANRHLFNKNELQDIYAVMNIEQNIKKLIPKEVSKGQAAVDKFVKTGKTISEVTGTMLDAYDKYNRVMKLLTGKGTAKDVKQLVKTSKNEKNKPNKDKTSDKPNKDKTSDKPNKDKTSDKPNKDKTSDNGNTQQQSFNWRGSTLNSTPLTNKSYKNHLGNKNSSWVDNYNQQLASRSSFNWRGSNNQATSLADNSYKEYLKNQSWKWIT